MIVTEATHNDLPTIAKVHVDTWRTTYRGILPDEHLANLSYERQASGWYPILNEDPEDGYFTYVAKEEYFYPADLQSEIDRVLDAIYQPINNGVYRSGFAVSQAAYTEAVTELFAALEYWEGILGQQPYLCGERITIADWCLFTTLFRFDLAYYGLFKCNLKRLINFPNLWNYCRKLYRYPGIRSICSVEHVKQLYYAGLPELNPSRIVPIGPTIQYL